MRRRPAAGLAAAPRPGQAVSDLLNGPSAQTDSDKAHTTQVAGVEREDDGKPPRVSRVGKAVPGKPDGELAP
jgi:hypothetical protein